MKRSVRANLLLTLTALIWGAAFVAQDVAADSLGSFTFNGLRMALAALAMLPVIAALDRKARKTGQDTSWRGMTPAQRRTLLTGGVCCGAMLALASAFQQMGIAMGTGAGKAGFITALYIVLVPLLGMLWGRRPAWLVWLAVLLSVAGLYLLCIGEDFSIAPGWAADSVRALLFRPYSGGGPFQPPDGLRENELPAICHGVGIVHGRGGVYGAHRCGNHCQMRCAAALRGRA